MTQKIQRALAVGVVAVFVGHSCVSSTCFAQSRLYQLVLKNGAVFEGKFSSISELSRDLTVHSAASGGVDVKNIVVVDDDLRRTFFPKRNLLTTNDAAQETVVKIDQRNSSARKRVGTVGAVLNATPFDKFGRRTITVTTSGGRQQIAQEITEISPVYTRLQSPVFHWDMRIATNSIPSDQIRAVLLNKGGDKAETRLDLVRILFLSKRFQEAARELDLAIKEFPELEENKLNRQRQALLTQGADLLLQEISLRRKAGQHRYVSFLLKGFENTGASTESRIAASEILAEYEETKNKAQQVLDELAPLVESAEGDPPRLKMIGQLHDEITSDLNLTNLPRMADFRNSLVGNGLAEDERLAVAISGWLLGQGESIRNVEVASSLLEVRNLVREYLRAMGDANRHVRQELLSRIADREGGTPEYVAKLLVNMKPPLDTPSEGDIANRYQVDVPGMPDGFPVQYDVQLPPEYDPYARYPVVVSLHAAGSTPNAQITWWAGEYDVKQMMRFGQATRHGYIVIAPAWTKPGQTRYEYSAREHHIVLASLRDAARRFSVDSDRVFISGHALGGDAAWDIAVAHPDLWAGMVVVGARADYGDSSPQYVTFYDLNAKAFPLYFVFGELDGNKMHANSIHLNRYMRPGYDPVLVQFQGRGNEHFYEEIQRIFDWLELQQRDPFPTEFDVDTMRPWDNFFWFTEFDGFPPRTMVSPYEWPTSKPVSARIEAKIANNRINIKPGGAARTTVWLSPEMVDFDQRIEVSVKGKRVREDIIPNLETILEDARSRADRQHVFWTKVTVQTGR